MQNDQAYIVHTCGIYQTHGHTRYTHYVYYSANNIQGHIFYDVPALNNIRIVTCGLGNFKIRITKISGLGQSRTVLEKNKKFLCSNYGLFCHCFGGF